MDDFLDLVCREYLDPVSRGCFFLAIGDVNPAHRQFACNVENEDMAAVYALDDPGVFRLCTRPLDLNAAVDANAAEIVTAFFRSRSDVTPLDCNNYAENAHKLHLTADGALANVYLSALRHPDHRIINHLLALAEPIPDNYMHLLISAIISPGATTELCARLDFARLPRAELIRLAHQSKLHIFKYLSGRYDFKMEGVDPIISSLSGTVQFEMIEAAARRGLLTQDHFFYVLGLSVAPEHPPPSTAVRTWLLTYLVKRKRLWAEARVQILRCPQMTAIAKEKTKILDHFWTTDALRAAAVVSGNLDSVRLVFQNPLQRASLPLNRSLLLDALGMQENTAIAAYLVDECRLFDGEDSGVLLSAISSGNTALFLLLHDRFPQAQLTDSLLQTAVRLTAFEIAEHIIAARGIPGRELREILRPTLFSRHRSASRTLAWYLDRIAWAFDSEVARTLRMDLNTSVAVLGFCSANQKVLTTAYAGEIGLNFRVFARYLMMRRPLRDLVWFLEETEHGRLLDAEPGARSALLPHCRTTDGLFYLLRNDRAAAQAQMANRIFTPNYPQLNRDLLFR